MKKEHDKRYVEINLICPECEKHFDIKDEIIIIEQTTNLETGMFTEKRIHNKCADLVYNICKHCLKSRKNCVCEKVVE